MTHAGRDPEAEKKRRGLRDDRNVQPVQHDVNRSGIRERGFDPVRGGA